MTPFVQSLTCQQVPPPYHFPGVTVHGFVVEVSMPHVQAYCDRYFNLGDAAERGFVYRAVPVWPYATFLVVDYPQMICSDPRPLSTWGKTFSDGGYVTQQEVFVAAPVLRHGTTPETALQKTALEWILPFIIVGNGPSASCGREMLGLEKLLADIDLGEGDYPGGFSAGIKLPGWPSLEPGVRQKMMPFLDVTTGPASPTFRGSPALDSLWTLFSGRLGGLLMPGLSGVSNLVDAMSLGLIPTTMRTISLKQIRDAQDPRRALHQSIVCCRSYYYDMSNFKFYNEKDVNITIHDHGSFSEIFRSLFSLPEIKDVRDQRDNPRRYQPAAAFSFNATIDFDEMRTLHRFPIDRGEGASPTPASDDMTAPWLRPLRGLFGGG